MSALYLKQATQAEIAQRLGVNQGTISRDLTALQEQWRQSSLSSIDQRKAEELARIDRVEREAWEAWERSCQNAEMMVVETTSDGDRERTKKHKRVEGRVGDPRFLERVGWCIERRCKVLGLDAVQKHEHTGGEGQSLLDWSSMFKRADTMKDEVEEQLQAELRKGLDERAKANGHQLHRDE